MRTEEELELYHVFGGVKEVGKGESLVDEIHGCTDNPATILKRIPGKLLCCSGSLGGPVWTLTGLRFRDRGGVFRQSGGIITVSPDPNPIPAGFVFPNFVPPDEILDPPGGGGGWGFPPLPVGWQPDNWPKSTPIPFGYQMPQQPKGPQGNVGGAPPVMQLFAAPSLQFNSPPDMSQITRKSMEVWTNDLGLKGDVLTWVRVNFTAPWLVVVTDDHNITPSGTRLYNGDTFSGKMWTGIHMPFEIGFDSTGMGVFAGTATITFTVVDQWGNMVKNPNGGIVTAAITVTLNVGDLNIQVVPVSITLSAYEE